MVTTQAGETTMRVGGKHEKEKGQNADIWQLATGDCTRLAGRGQKGLLVGRLTACVHGRVVQPAFVPSPTTTPFLSGVAAPPKAEKCVCGQSVVSCPERRGRKLRGSRLARLCPSSPLNPCNLLLNDEGRGNIGTRLDV